MPRADDVDPRRCIAVGGGVDQAITGKKCSFAVQGCYGYAQLVEVTIDGPAQPSVSKEADDSGNIICTYTPSLPGEYIINIKVKEKTIKNNPYKCEVIGDSDPKLKKVALVEVAGKGIIIGKATQQNEFWVDCRKANITAGLAVTVKPPERASTQLNITDMGDGTFKVHWKPTTSGLYVVNVKVEGVHVPNSPFYVRATN